MTGVSMAASAGGSILGAMGAREKGAANASAYMYQAAVAEQNARIAKQNAEYERQVGGVEAIRQAMKDRFDIGRTRAQRSASNIALDSGSAADVEDSQRLLARHNTDVIRANAARRAYGYEVEAVSQTGEASMKRASAGYAKKAGDIEALGSILGGISSVSGQFARAGSAGVFSGSPSYSSGMGNPTRIGSLY